MTLDEKVSKVSCESAAPAAGQDKEQDTVHIARTARYRAEQLIDAVCAWAYRWGVISDASIQALYPVQRRIVSGIQKKGYLEMLEVPAGEFCLDGRKIYRLTDAGIDRAEDCLPPDIRDIEYSSRISWRTLQHLLDLQRIAARTLGMLPADEHWRTEPELRVLAQQSNDQLVPDLRVAIADEDGGEDGEWWIEYERRGDKADAALDYWVQQIARRVQRAHDERNPKSQHYISDAALRRPLIRKLTVIVKNEKKADRYTRYFDREYAELRLREKDSRKTKTYEDKPLQPISSILSPIREITWIGYINDIKCREDIEEQRQAVLNSRYIPGL